MATITKSHLQLLGVSCLNLAAKYEEDRGTTPPLDDLAEITDNAYNVRQIIKVNRYTRMRTDTPICQHTVVRATVDFACEAV